MSWTYFVSKLSIRSWLGGGTSRKERRRNARRKAPRTRLEVEVLEDRLAPASLVQAAGVLSIHLNVTNETLQISSNGAGNYDLTTTSTFSDGGLAPSTF